MSYRYNFNSDLNRCPSDNNNRRPGLLLAVGAVDSLDCRLRVWWCIALVRVRWQCAMHHQRFAVREAARSVQPDANTRYYLHNHHSGCHHRHHHHQVGNDNNRGFTRLHMAVVRLVTMDGHVRQESSHSLGRVSRR